MILQSLPVTRYNLKPDMFWIRLTSVSEQYDTEVGTAAHLNRRWQYIVLQADQMIFGSLKPKVSA